MGAALLPGLLLHPLLRKASRAHRQTQLAHEHPAQLGLRGLLRLPGEEADRAEDQLRRAAAVRDRLEPTDRAKEERHQINIAANSGEPAAQA